MKKLFIILATAVIIAAQETPTAEETATVPVIATNKIAALPNVMATLKWRLGTNWIASGILVSNATNPGDQREIENGLIASNLVATIIWKGRTNEVIIEQIGVAQIQRTFKWTQTKVYQP